MLNIHTPFSLTEHTLVSAAFASLLIKNSNNKQQSTRSGSCSTEDRQEAELFCSSIITTVGIAKQRNRQQYKMSLGKVISLHSNAFKVVHRFTVV